jgi:hypothetical protein
MPDLRWFDRRSAICSPQGPFSARIASRGAPPPSSRRADPSQPSAPSPIPFPCAYLRTAAPVCMSHSAKHGHAFMRQAVTRSCDNVTITVMRIYRCPRCRAGDISADAHPARVMDNGIERVRLPQCIAPPSRVSDACQAADGYVRSLRDGLFLLRGFCGAAPSAATLTSHGRHRSAAAAADPRCARDRGTTPRDRGDLDSLVTPIRPDLALCGRRTPFPARRPWCPRFGAAAATP